MNQTALSLLHRDRARRQMRQRIRRGEASEEERARYETLCDEMLDGLVDVVIDLARELQNVAAAARRPRPY